jgi:hypothetical protein
LGVRVGTKAGSNLSGTFKGAKAQIVAAIKRIITPSAINARPIGIFVSPSSSGLLKDTSNPFYNPQSPSNNRANTGEYYLNHNAVNHMWMPTPLV